jgi:hypothetical protein
MSHKMGASGRRLLRELPRHARDGARQAGGLAGLQAQPPKTCGKCHDNAKLTKEYQMGTPRPPATTSTASTGGPVKMGLIVAPSCNDCHGVHDIKRSIDKDSRSNHANIAKTCGACHVGIEEIYNESVHGQLLAQGRQGPGLHRLPQRPRHRETRRTRTSKWSATKSCGKCHEDRLAHYRDTYHGKAMALGQPNVASDVAACYDCHGHHDVFPVSDPLAPVQGQDRRHVPAMSPGRELRASRNTRRTPTRSTSENYPILNKVFLFMTDAADGRVLVLRPAHAVLAVPRRSTSTCTTRKRSAKPKSRRDVDDDVCHALHAL